MILFLRPPCADDRLIVEQSLTNDRQVNFSAAEYVHGLYAHSARGMQANSEASGLTIARLA